VDFGAAGRGGKAAESVMKSRGAGEIKGAGAAERLILNARITVGRVHVEDGAMAGSGRKVGLQNRIFF
jgi:hypothetical protein